jgi:hypothetical protein
MVKTQQDDTRQKSSRKGNRQLLLPLSALTSDVPANRPIELPKPAILLVTVVLILATDDEGLATPLYSR